MSKHKTIYFELSDINYDEDTDVTLASGHILELDGRKTYQKDLKIYSRYSEKSGRVKLFVKGENGKEYEVMES